MLDQLHLRLGSRFGEVVVHTGFLGDCRGGERVVTGDHYRANTAGAQLGESFGDALFDDVLEFDHAEHPAPFGDDQRCRAGPGHRLYDRVKAIGRDAALLADPAFHRVGRAFADLSAVQIDSGHPRGGHERDEGEIGSQITFA